MKYIIKDWAGNVCFFEQEFESWDDAEDFLCEMFGAQKLVLNLILEGMYISQLR